MNTKITATRSKRTATATPARRGAILTKKIMPAKQLNYRYATAASAKKT